MIPLVEQHETFHSRFQFPTEWGYARRCFDTTVTDFWLREHLPLRGDNTGLTYGKSRPNGYRVFVRVRTSARDFCYHSCVHTRKSIAVRGVQAIAYS